MTDSQHNPQDEADQITRQRAALMEDAPLRMLAGAVAYGIALLLLPAPVVLACAAVDMGAEIAVMRMMRQPARLLRGPGRWVYLAGSALIEAAFLLPAALASHAPNPLAMVFAVGMMCGSMLQITTVRAIHLPMGMTGAATVAVTALASNVLQWRGPGELGELAASGLAILAFAGYAISALMSNHRLHRSAALARHRAEAADAAKGRFLTQTSHELRTPLNAILGMGRAVQMRTADPVNRDRMATLLRAAEGLAAMLDDILDLTAVQEGRLPLRPRPCDPRDEIAATLALFQPRAEELGLTLTLDLDPAVPARATFDPQRLRQCLSNLLSNALKATARGGIRVEATVAARAGGPPTAVPQPPGSQILKIIVADTGPGVPAHRRADLFDGTGAGRGGAAGHGLGLSIARALARQLGGDLVLLPQPGPGARFLLTIEIGPAAQAAQPEALPAPALPPVGRVLVIDDIATNRLVACTYLQMQGIAAVEAGSGAEALPILAAGGIAAVLLDLNMPGMDGASTLTAIRALPGAPGRVPVIAMTADANTNPQAAARALGLDGYVTKPVDPETLIRALRRLQPARRQA